MPSLTICGNSRVVTEGELIFSEKATGLPLAVRFSPVMATCSAPHENGS